MRTEDEIQKAIQARVKQLDEGLDVLNTKNGPYLSRAIMEAVREELETLLGWIGGDKEP
jgi:hypothetical protein